MQSLGRFALVLVALVLILLGAAALAYLLNFLTSDGADLILLVGYLPIWGGFLMLGVLGVALLRLAAKGRP
jgi:hypothetical protein